MGADLSGPNDLAVAPDLAGSPDLATQPDLSPPTVTGLPTDCSGGVTASQLYQNIVQQNCTTSYCHGNAGSVWKAQSASDLRAAWVNHASVGAPSMPYVTPGDVNKSYVMYKLTGQMSKVVSDPSAAGDQMPLGAPPLGHDDLCQFIAWINAGAQ